MKKNNLKKIVYHSMRLEGYKIKLNEKKLKEIKTKYNVKVYI